MFDNLYKKVIQITFTIETTKETHVHIVLAVPRHSEKSVYDTFQERGIDNAMQWRFLYEKNWHTEPCHLIFSKTKTVTLLLYCNITSTEPIRPFIFFDRQHKEEAITDCRIGIPFYNSIAAYKIDDLPLPKKLHYSPWEMFFLGVTLL